jgi:hypothetical protein
MLISDLLNKNIQTPRAERLARKQSERMMQGRDEAQFKKDGKFKASDSPTSSPPSRAGRSVWG